MTDIQWLQLAQVFMTAGFFILLINIKHSNTRIDQLSQTLADAEFETAKSKMKVTMNGQPHVGYPVPHTEFDDLRSLLKKQDFLINLRKNRQMWDDDRENLKIVTAKIKEIINK